MGWLRRLRRREIDKTRGGSRNKGVDYVTEIRLSWGDNPLGQGPTGTAIRTGEPAVSATSARARSSGPGEAAVNSGYVSSISLPPSYAMTP